MNVQVYMSVHKHCGKKTHAHNIYMFYYVCTCIDVCLRCITVHAGLSEALSVSAISQDPLSILSSSTNSHTESAPSSAKSPARLSILCSTNSHTESTSTSAKCPAPLSTPCSTNNHPESTLISAKCPAPLSTPCSTNNHPESNSISAKTPASLSTPSSTKLYKTPASVQDPLDKSPSTPVLPVLSQLLVYPTPTRNTTKIRDK